MSSFLSSFFSTARIEDIWPLIEQASLLYQSKPSQSQQLTSLLTQIKNHINTFPQSLKEKRGQRLSTPLHEAVGGGCPQLVKLMLQYESADLRLRDIHGWTPLHVCCSSAHSSTLDVLRILLSQRSPPVRACTDSGNTPLHYLARNTACLASGSHDTLYADLASSLVDQGAAVDAQNKQGVTPLHEAVSRNNRLGVIVLLRSSAKLDVSNHKGLTPLHWAVLAAHTKIARLLLVSGADPDAPSPEGSPRQIAQKSSRDELVQLFHSPKQKSPPLLRAAVSAASSDSSKIINLATKSSPNFVSQSCSSSPVASCSSCSPPPTSSGFLTDPNVATLIGYYQKEKKFPLNQILLAMYQLSEQQKPINTETMEKQLMLCDDDEHLCKICQDEKIDTVLIPCAHSACCYDCAQSVKQTHGNCPICRVTIDQVLRIYVV